MSTKNEIKQSQVIKRVLVELKTYRLQIVLSLICAVLTVIFTLLVPVLTGKAVDCMIGSGQIQWDGLYQILEKMALAIVGTCFFQWLMNRINNYITYDITKNMRQKAFKKMLVMPIKNIDSHSHGDYMSRIATDADVFSDGLLMGFTQLFTGVLTILGTIFFMVRVSLPIALVVIVLTPVSLLVAKFVASRTYAMFQLQAKHRGEQTAYADEMIENQSVVSAFSYNEKAKEEFDVLNDRLADSSLKATFYSSITNPTTRFVNSLIYSGVGVAGAILAIFGGITVGGLTSFLGYASQYAKPFNEISGVVTELQNAIACAARIFEIIDAPAVEESRVNHLSDVEGKIVFEDVAFSYDPSKPLIEHLNLTVEPGQRIAIVGPTGSGKTTLINLLMRFYDTTHGKITIDGVDIRSIPRANLREKFGMVLQETWLKEGTIRENLLFANPDATEEEMVQAARTSHAHEFIKRLPNGYDTYIKGDDGSLSQGERQLLCIARLMLALPPMLILDEATSSIDTRTEMKIQEAFQTMMEGRTTFVVAHRLSTIREADVILYMQDGKVLEQGNHQELLEKNGYYAKLYRSQFVCGK
ncbi:ABC transporter ATP-binding protein [Roseburia sp. AM16-25]|uniref:ABC transporter ATP-binding protein n=1 Tax=Roseburia sp. AM16-25 TaxID=2292065 RepID=UPI000E4BA5ED|nr:ABC transporter ATP-binding protein [Roseburia sp. AM16-25]RHO30597.1 ABC transporter ATP-binding protein [Roseburia sp. AM16-25]